MDKKTSPHNTSNLSNDENIKSKLRRLRIQEGLLLQSLQKQNKNTNEDKNSSAAVLNTSEYKHLLVKVKDSYIDLKNLFHEVVTTTQSQELLADIDIDDMKKKIFEIETNIKTFKAEINTELAALKETYKQINEIPTEVERANWRPKTNPVSYNSIVQSPVRVLISSPFKYSEVQQFQDFMQNSPNRYGGWNEYNHNVFVKYWHNAPLKIKRNNSKNQKGDKYFGKNADGRNVFDSQDKTLLQSVTHDAFIEDVAPRLHDVTITDIATHIQWYTKYLQLKENQQNAIKKWKISKMAAIKIPKKVKYADEYDSLPLETTMDEQNIITCHFTSSKHDYSPNTSEDVISKRRGKKTKGKHKKHDRASTLLKPTKQWLNRNRTNCDDTVGLSNIQCLENIDKLCTPHWRQGL